MKIEHISGSTLNAVLCSLFLLYANFRGLKTYFNEAVDNLLFI